jgi:hypothetical protein
VASYTRAIKSFFSFLERSVLPATENLASKSSNTSLSVPIGLLSPTEKKVLKGLGIALVVEALFPGFFERR